MARAVGGIVCLAAMGVAGLAYYYYVSTLLPKKKKKVTSEEKGVRIFTRTKIMSNILII